MKKSRKLEHPSWSYDVRSGWSEVEDIVLAASADRTKMDEALSETGFSSKLLALESDSQIRCTIYSNCMGRCPEYYVEMLSQATRSPFILPICHRSWPCSGILHQSCKANVVRPGRTMGQSKWHPLTRWTGSGATRTLWKQLRSSH